MNRSQSWRKFPSDERDDFGEDKRANSSSQPNLSMSLGSPQRSSKSNVDELRRKIVRLNKELEEERLYIKQIKREKSIELKHAKEEEQRRAANQQTELRTKLYKEKANELATLKEHIVKDKEKEILQIIKQKDETLKAAQLAWQKEKDELRVKIRAELWNDAREESKKEFDRERAKLEQDILDLQMQKKEIEETLKTVQESDKRKADEIRRLFHEHDMDMGKFKRNSWQESRRQMAEIRQLLNIIEQLERKLGLDSGHINKLRMEKESLYDELRRKTNTFDAWDSMMSTDSDGATDTKYSNPSHELRTLQRKNVELSSLVKKLDEKNQQLATRNTELLSELEQCEKEARDKNRKLEKKNLELTQSTKKLETKNKALLDELNSLKRKAGPAVTGSKDSRKAVRPRGQGTDITEVTTLKEQIKDHAKTIEELKQNLMEKERRIDLLKERKRTGKKPKIGRSTADSGLQPDKDETSSVVSDISDLSEVSSDSNSDANKLKKLAKELLALERAYAILQAQVGSTVDVERDELERQQLQSDLIESQARIHELERMMDGDLQGGTEELQDLQHDNQVLYQKLVSAEKERDQALNELSNNTEHLKDLQDKKDLLEFELEEMSQLSYGGSEDEFSPRKQADKDNVKLPLSLEDVKAQLEELETEKSNVLSDINLEALRQARTSLTAMPQKISHLEATEAILRSKVKDLEERRNTIHRPYYIDDTQQVSHVAEMESLNKTDDQSDTMNQNITEFTDVDFEDHMNVKQFENKDSVTELTSVELCDMERIYEKFLRDSHVDFCNQSTNTDSSSVTKVDSEVMTDFVWVDIVEVEETYKEFLENMASFEGLSLVKPTLNKIEKETATDFSYYDIVKLETMGRQLEELHEAALKRGEQRKEQGCNTEVVEKHETECNTDHVQKYDMFSLTDLTMSEIDQKRDMLAVSMSRVQDLENELLINKNEAMVKNNKLEQQEREYKEKIKNLNELLAEEKKMRKTDQAKVKDRELLYQGLVDRFTVEVQHTMAQEIVETAIGNALTALVNETLDKTFRSNTMQEMNHLKALIQGKDETLEQLQKQLIESIKLDEVKALRVALAEKEQSLTELRDMLIEAEVEKDKIVQNLGEDINALQKQLLREKELREEEILQQQCLNEHRESYEHKIIECQAINQELQEQVKDLQEQHLNEESKLSEYREKIEKNELLYYQRCQEKIAQDTVTKAIINALSEVVNTRMMALKRQITSEEEVREFYEEMIEQYEKLHQESLNEKDSSQYQRAAHTIVLKAVNDAVSVVANVAITDLHEQLERQHGNEEELKETQERVDLLRQEIAVQRLVMKAVVNALSHVANEAIHSVLYDLQQQANSKQTSLSRHNETLTDLTDEYIENLQDPYQSNLLELELLRSTMSEQERELGKVNDEISVLRHDKKDLDDKCVLLSQQDQLNREQINDLQQKLKMEQNRQETSEKNNRAVQQDLVEEMQLNIAHMIVKNVVSNAIATEQMNNLQEQLKMKQEIQETMEEKLIENEEVYQQFVKTLTEQEKEKIAKSIVSESITSALVQVSNEIIHDLQHHLLMEQETKEAVAKKYVEITVDKDEAEVMTDLRWEDINHMENNYQQLIEDLQQQLTTQNQRVEDEKTNADKYQMIIQEHLSRTCEDKCSMTDMEWTQDLLERTAKDIGQRSQLDAIFELANEGTNESVKIDKVTMTEVSWKEIEWVEELRLMKEDIQRKAAECKDQICMTDGPCLQDALVMTDLDLEQIAALEMVKDKSVLLHKDTMTDLKWDDVMYLETTYLQNLDELQIIAASIKDSEHKETIGRESMTELSWTDVLSLETSYKEELEKISLLEESLHHVNNDLMDEGTMTTLNWYEVECQLGTYRDQIDALKQMLEDEKARSSVEQIQVTEAGIVERSCMDELGWAFSLDAIEDDVEVDDDILVNSFQQSKQEAASMTDIGWQDLVCKDSFDNSMNDKCCSTDITLQCSAHINITAMEEKVEKESTTDLSVIDLINMEDIYWQEMQRLEELSEKHCKLADKNCMTDQVLTDNTECMTELSSYDIDQMNKEEQHTTIDDKDLKSKKENTLTDKLEPKHESDANIGFEFDESLEDSLTRDRDHRTQETSTDITLDDMVYFEDLEVKHHELMMKTKQGSMSPLDKNGKPISTNKQTDTNVTLDDMNYSELSIDQLENKHIPTSPSGDLHEGTPHNLTIDTVRCDQETSTELTLDQLDHLENLQLQNQELDKEQWKGVSASHVSNVLLIDQETETDFTDTDFDHFESLIHELKLENELYKQQFADKEPDKDLQDKQVETELDDVESLIHELKLENELYKQQLADKDKDLQDKQVETELTLEDIDMYEDSELSWIDYKAQSEQEIESLNKEYNEVKKRKASLESHFQELEQIHQKCVDRQTRSSEQAVDTELTLEHLSHLEEFKSLHQQCSERKVCTDIGVATDLTLTEIHYLEEIDTVHTEYCMTSMDNDASSRTESSATESKAVGTELTASVLAYLEEVSSTHEDIVREYEAFRQSVNKETNEADTMTEMTIEHLDYLDEMALKSEELENMLIDVTEEAKLKQYEFENKKKVFSKELMTDLSLSDINILENELSGLRQRQKESRKSVKLSRSGYECLLDIDNTKKRHDIALMTELTIDNLKSLENSDNLYMDLKERGDLSRLEDLNKPMDEHSTITDLRGTNIDHLEHIETLYGENERRKGNMRDKQTETSQNIVDPPEETLTTVETAEAVFGSCPREKRSRAGRYANVDHLNDYGNHGSNSVEVGVQCELKDLLSLIREQHEKDGKDDSQWYVSALKIKREYKEGFDPVEVVLRSGRKSSTPDVSSRDYGNKRDSFVDHKGNTTSASLDYGWQSTMSLDASGLERTPTKGTAIGRWDSPQVPLAQDEVFDISDIDSTASEESLIAPLRKESAVSKFDRYVMARKESEIELLSNLRDTTDQADGPNRTRRNMTEVLKENEALKMRILELELLVSQKGDLSDEELQLLKQKIKQLQAAEQQMEELHESNSALKDRLNQLHDDNLESGASTSRTVRDNWSEIDPSEGRADNATQAGPGPGINQEIQTTGDLLKLIDLSYDGTIPDHIAKELEKLKIENKELYQELLQLRKLKLKNSQASDSGIIPRDTIEEPVTSSVQTPSESHNDWMTVLGVTDDGQSNRPKYQQPVKDLDDVLNDNPRPKGRQYPTNTIDEPEIKTSRSSRDVTADIDRGINHLSEMDDARPRTDTDAILDFDLEHFGPPDIAPPPVPSEPPPDNDPYGLDNSSNSVFDSSPLRDSKALRAATRTRNQPGRPVISESTIQPHVEMNVEGQPTSPGLADIPPALRISQTPVQNRPGITMQPFTPKPVPPPTLPKPKATHPGGVRRPGTMSREADDDVGITPRGYVRATASAINQGEIDALGEKINFLEKQLKNKDGVIRSMKNEATEIENKALVERKEREIKLLEDDVAFLKQENQKKERDLLVKTGEINRKSYEVDQWKAEATNAEKQRKRIETSYMNLQSQTRNLHGANNKLSELQSKFNSLEKENSQLLDQVNKLEKAEKEFKQLEYNITVLQNHLRDMESVEKERDELSNKLKTVENQRDDLLKKGRMVESERNDFLRNNKIMEMQRDELEQRYAIAHEDLMNLKATAGDLEQSIKEAENTSLDTKHECNYLQTQYKKLEAEKLELEHQLSAVTRERNGLDARLAELEDRSREYLKLEDGFHTLRLKVAELTRQRDEFETQIPTLKAKVTLLKKACKEKDEFIDKLNEEIRELRHSIATSTLDDLSKIKSYGYSPDSFVKYSGKQGKESKSPSTKTSPRKAFPKRCVALFDYNPRTASVSGQPDKELTLKEGDHVTLLADMDIHGCYEAELNGVKGLVPGLYVEDVDECLDSTSKDPMTKKRTPVANNNVEPDVINSMNHGSTSPRSKASDIDIQRQCFVALFDYDPYQSCTSGRPELELPFRKGDIMTVYGDMDSNRYYRAEMEGQTGLVPSNFVEEVSSSTFLQPQSYSSTAPRQILSMFDNIKVSSPQRPGSSFPLPTPPYTSPRQVTNSHPPSLGIVPSSHMTAPVFSAHPGGVMTSNHVIHPVPSTNGITPSVATTSPRREQTIQPIFTPHMSPAEVQKLAAPIATSKPRASQRSPRQQSLTSKRSSSQPVTSPPRITSQNNQLVNKPKPSKALASRPTGSRGLPSPPTNLHVLRPVNHDAILLGWTLPELDEFGRSNGTVVKGYKIYENSDYKMDVRSQFMAKALVDNLDLRYPIQFTVRTIGEGGTLSTEASTTFTDTINNSRMSISKAIEGTVGSGDQHRTFVALYDYDPLKNSPNANPQYELHFSEGDILRVEDISRKDGFYFGSLNGKKGLIPSNFIEEVAVRTPSSPIRKDHDASIGSSQRHRKKMVALYDYNPKEQSPLKNTEAELSFRKGQTITVLGPMNKDGFYNAAIDGRQGLVPASFLETSLELSQSNQRPPRSA